MIKFKILMERFLEDSIESEVVLSGIHPSELDIEVSKLNKTAKADECFRWEPEFA